MKKTAAKSVDLSPKSVFLDVETTFRRVSPISLPRDEPRNLCAITRIQLLATLSAIDLQQTCGGEYNHYLIASETDKGPIRTCEKVVCLDKISVTTNRLQVRMVCRDLTNFGRSGQIFRRITDKICPR